jgi:hypothetical protein
VLTDPATVQRIAGFVAHRQIAQAA